MRLLGMGTVSSTGCTGDGVSVRVYSVGRRNSRYEKSGTYDLADRPAQ